MSQVLSLETLIRTVYFPKIPFRSYEKTGIKSHM